MVLLTALCSVRSGRAMEITSFDAGWCYSGVVAGGGGYTSLEKD
jgi:hypothetical protein